MTNKSTFSLSEDWVVVILCFLSIVAILSGLDIAVPVYNWNDFSELQEKVVSVSNLGKIALIFGVMLAVALLGGWLLKRLTSSWLGGFVVLYLLTTLALILTGNAWVRSLNLESVIVSLGLGLLISNLFHVPEWLRTVLSTELYVKIGLILLGANVIFGDILKAGTLGLVQALVVVILVWYFAYWISRKWKVDQEMSVMLASAVSICGVSAAIATSGAIKGDGKKLSYVISLVLITAIPMMIGMPYLAKWMGLSQEVTGAWLGGTIDTTGAVVASGSLVGEAALKISTIVKFSQNVLLGVAAFAISVYWSYIRTEKDSSADLKPTLGIIWNRFPKFVLGFVAASLLCSFVVKPEVLAEVKGSFKYLQTVWFTLAFTSIGLETRFRDLFNRENQRPLYAFLVAQLFNVLVTLVMARLLFG